MEHVEKSFLDEVKAILDDYVSYLASMGLTIDDNGDIVEKGSRKLVLKVDDSDEDE